MQKTLLPRGLRSHKPDSPFSDSNPSNFAEGYGMLNAKEFRQFLGMARGSTYELQTRLELAQSLEFASLDQIESSSKLS